MRLTLADLTDPRSGLALDEYLVVMRRLARECPWKAAQTHTSLARYLLEETYETLEAIEGGDAAHLREELGDLLLQVVLHSVIAEQAGEFSFAEVVEGISAKMVRRNPHVFDSSTPSRLTPEETNEVYQAAKQAEKAEQAAKTGKAGTGRTEPLEGVPSALPALLWADKVADRLERDGRALEVDPDAEELGERLLGLVLEARAAGSDPEQALRAAVRRRLG